MLRLISRIWHQIGRKWRYLLICGLIALALILINLQPLKSQTPAAESIPEPKAELVDLEHFSEIVDKLERKWENDYERYFERNFSNRSRSATKIAEHLAEIHQQLGIQPAVVWAVPKEDFLQLILVTPQRQFVTKQIRAARRNRLIKRINELQIGVLNRQTLDYLPPARIIYQWLFAPLEPYLAAEKIDTLLLCTGPSLRSLPFAALHDGEQFVIEKYNLARIPAFNLTDTEYNPQPGDKNILAMGASEFEDLPSLPGVEVELNTIVPKLWSGRKIINQNFTVENLQNAYQQEDFDIIHIASHSRFSSGSPDNSYIQFSDRKVNLDQIADLELDLSPIDLLVLSACETALGDEEAEFGFAGLAMQAGVKSALATLWRISDAGTIVLMSEFYQQLKFTPIKAQALRQAQINLLQRKVFAEGTQVRGSDLEINLPPPTTTDNQFQNFEHPFYWAGFTIIGNPW